MLKKVIGLVSLVSLGSAAAFMGCSSTAVDTTPVVDAGGTTDAKPATVDSGKDTGVIAIADTGPTSCYDETGAKKLNGTTITAGRGVCTPTQVGAFETACLAASATAATCKAFTDNAANKDCGACISGGNLADGGVNPNFPVLLPVTSKIVQVNVAGCGYALINQPACAANAVNFTMCTRSSCDTCPDKTTDPETKACLDIAKKSTTCAAFAESTTCTDALATNKATVDATCVGTTFVEYYTKVANFLCGAGGGGG